jgi:hypothetical protein
MEKHTAATNLNAKKEKNCMKTVYFGENARPGAVPDWPYRGACSHSLLSRNRIFSPGASSIA